MLQPCTHRVATICRHPYERRSRMDLTEIQHADKKVLTTAQIAEAYEVDSKSLIRNFQRNKEHYQEGTHYFALTGEALKQFKGGRQNDATLKFVSLLYLWTEEGAFLLAKSLKSDKAWEAYHLLVAQYYKLTTELQQVQAISLPYDEKRLLALEQRVQEIEQQLHGITLHTGEQKRLRQAVTERVNQLCMVQARRPAFFASLYREIKRRYQVVSYRDVPQCKLQDALHFISTWRGGADT
ncbi:hypothetical protein FC756_22915 [Lysinibacillus mangiferihumi]|uniref:KilA-N DNA-binding domain-containing protein n=2 Tax=Lysinibacillus mangiferihumi TaxID=1130819 RepID=A0A4U2Y0W3_9BACI|nr:hypothetical protein FC756_22915 [Lysinibacillus mangiferihumi]